MGWKALPTPQLFGHWAAAPISLQNIQIRQPLKFIFMHSWGITLKNCISLFLWCSAPMVVSRMSPLGVVHWKIVIAYFRGAQPKRRCHEWAPLGKHIENRNWCQKLNAPPPAGGQENSFAPQMIFLGLRPGGWANNWIFANRIIKNPIPGQKVKINSCGGIKFHFYEL